MRILLTANASYAPPRGGATRSNLVWLDSPGARRPPSFPITGPSSKGARRGERPRNSPWKVIGGPVLQPPVTLPGLGESHIPTVFGRFRQVHSAALSTRRAESSSWRCLAPQTVLELRAFWLTLGSPTVVAVLAVERERRRAHGWRVSLWAGLRARPLSATPCILTLLNAGAGANLNPR
jgi:hypothetical protein